MGFIYYVGLGSAHGAMVMCMGFCQCTWGFGIVYGSLLRHMGLWYCIWGFVNVYVFGNAGGALLTYAFAMCNGRERSTHGD